MITTKPPATVATLSAEREAMQGDIDLIADIRAGLGAMRARSALYLPKYESETATEYQRRVASAPWRPEFNDILLTLASKPFSREVGFPEATPAPVLKFAEDVDGRGNNLHVFSHNLFLDALSHGVALITVDYPAGLFATIADQKAAGARPYWLHIPISRIIACRTDHIGGKERIVHLRLREDITEPDGEWGEKQVEQVRVVTPDAWQLWRKKAQTQYSLKEEWELYDEGPLEPFDGGVRAVPLFLGERLGDIRVRPPLLDLAHMQIELFRALSRQEEVLTYAGSPMLSAAGVSPLQADGRVEQVQIGPKRVLYSPPSPDGKFGSWSYVQPDAANLREIREHVGNIIEDMQRLGLQPTIARAGQVSATEFAITSAKAHSALEAWALALKDTLEQALVFTIPWLDYDQQRAIGNWPVTVDVHSDFSADVQAATEAGIILNAQKAGVLSKQTARDELARRGMLGPNFDPAEEESRLAAAE